MTKSPKEMSGQRAIRERIKGAIDQAPSIHFNGFINTIAAAGDFLVVLESNGKPAAALNASYTVIKSFANSLTQIAEDLEKRSGNKIMTSSEIQMYLEGRNDDQKQFGLATFLFKN